MSSIAVPVPEGKAVCTMCGKLFDKPVVASRDSDLCPECHDKYKDMAFIYCSQCHAVVSRVSPGAFNGTIVVPGDILVVDKCPQCADGTVKSEVLKVVHNGSREKLP
jgi:hypothetical protein